MAKRTPAHKFGLNETVRTLTVEAAKPLKRLKMFLKNCDEDRPALQGAYGDNDVQVVTDGVAMLYTRHDAPLPAELQGNTYFEFEKERPTTVHMEPQEGHFPDCSKILSNRATNPKFMVAVDPVRLAELLEQFADCRSVLLQFHSDNSPFEIIGLEGDKDLTDDPHVYAMLMPMWRKKTDESQRPAWVDAVDFSGKTKPVDTKEAGHAYENFEI